MAWSSRRESVDGAPRWARRLARWAGIGGTTWLLFVVATFAQLPMAVQHASPRFQLLLALFGGYLLIPGVAAFWSAARTRHLLLVGLALSIGAHVAIAAAPSATLLFLALPAHGTAIGLTLHAGALTMARSGLNRGARLLLSGLAMSAGLVFGALLGAAFAPPDIGWSAAMAVVAAAGLLVLGARESRSSERA